MLFFYFKNMNCLICLDRYNKFHRRPITLFPCSHTFCLKCVVILHKSSPLYSNCPKCRRRVHFYKSNHGLIDLLEKNPILMNQMSRNESVTLESEKYYSLNHDHNFEVCEQSSVWKCDGEKMLGDCKSIESISAESACYKCTLCKDFKLCRQCLEEPERTADNFFYSPNHEHRLNKSRTDDGWMCSGLSVFGGCKSNLNSYGLSSSMTRYRCPECIDFDFCQACFDAPKLEETYLKKKHLASAEPLNISDLFNLFNTDV